MNISQQIRITLKKCGEAMNLAQLADANDWTKEERAEASKRLSAMKARGELTTKVEEGKAVFALNAGYANPGKRGRKLPARGKSIHIGRADKTPKPEKVAHDFDEAKAAADAQRARHAAEAAAAEQLVSQCRGGQLFGKSARSDLDLAKRLDVVVEDIQELLEDALDSDQAKDLIKQLVAAGNAVNRAARLYRRS